MIYPKSKQAKMTQLKGSEQGLKALHGGERIYSKDDTYQIVAMCKQAKTKSDYIKLGEYVLQATKKQDINQGK